MARFKFEQLGTTNKELRISKETTTPGVFEVFTSIPCNTLIWNESGGQIAFGPDQFFKQNKRIPTLNFSDILDAGGTAAISVEDAFNILSAASNYQNEGGGGGGGDASAANQATQIALAQAQFASTSDLVREVSTGRLLKQVINRSEDGNNTDTVVYYDADGAVATPVGKLEFISIPELVTNTTGALVTASNTPQFNMKLTQSKRPDFYAEVVSGTATSVHDKANACVNMTVNETGDYVIRQSIIRPPYKPGDTQVVLLTGNFSEGEGLNQAIGAFNTNGTAPYNDGLDGLLFRKDSGGLWVEVWKSDSPTPKVKVEQANWNIDKLDGTGPSGYTLDDVKSQIFAINFLWLGVAGPVFGFWNNQKELFTPVHAYSPANNEVGVFMSSPNHSLRWEIRSEGGSGTMQHICGAVFSQNGEASTGRNFSAYRSIEEPFLVVQGIGYNPILAVRLKDTDLDASVLLKSFSLLSTTNANASYIITMNPRLQLNATTDITWDDPSISWDQVRIKNSPLEVAVLDTIQPYNLWDEDQGDIIFSGEIANNSDATAGFDAGELKLGTSIDSTDQFYKSVLVLAVDTTSNENFNGSLNFQEL